MWAHTRTIAIFLLAAGMVACGTDAENAESPVEPTVASTTSASTPANTAGDDEAPPEPESVDVGLTAYYQGFVWEITDASFGPSPLGNPTVLVDAIVSNPGEKAGQPNPTIAIESGGVGYVALSTGQSRIDAGSSIDMEMEFQVDPGSFDLATATLVIGNPDFNQARVPLGQEAQEAQLREPIVTGIVVDNAPSGFLVEVTDVAIRWDDPVAYAQSEIGTAFIQLTFDLTTEANTTYAKRNMGLALPDGTEIEPASAPNSRIDVGEPHSGLIAVFEVTDPPSGVYRFFFQDLLNFTGETIEVELDLG